MNSFNLENDDVYKYKYTQTHLSYEVGVSTRMKVRQISDAMWIIGRTRADNRSSTHWIPHGSQFCGIVQSFVPSFSSEVAMLDNKYNHLSMKFHLWSYGKDLRSHVPKPSFPKIATAIQPILAWVAADLSIDHIKNTNEASSANTEIINQIIKQKYQSYLYNPALVLFIKDTPFLELPLLCLLIKDKNSIQCAGGTYPSSFAIVSQAVLALAASLTNSTVCKQGALAAIPNVGFMAGRIRTEVFEILLCYPTLVFCGDNAPIAELDCMISDRSQLIANMDHPVS
ncbi:hypothetical protein BU17DRAFT_65005 [Hysterangium stoloniferum]|nr:hypothetical protein BU17DRAFT_65005 [Hysterangium stoloniferum]